jgi:hypothetical protein
MSRRRASEKSRDEKSADQTENDLAGRETDRTERSNHGGIDAEPQAELDQAP